MRNTFKILFYVNKQRMKEGRIPVYARLTVNGKNTFVNCRVTCRLPYGSKANKAAARATRRRRSTASWSISVPKSSGITSVSPTATPMSRPSG